MSPRPRAATLARQAVSGLPLYSPNDAPCAVDLSDNTNLWGAPPAAMRAIGETPATAVARYPSCYSISLRSAMLQYLGLDKTPDIGIVTGCGSDDLIDATMRAFGVPGESVAFSAPTFTMIPYFARLNGLTPVGIPLMPHCDIDAQQLVECGAKITYVCAPNNPTATAVSRSSVEYVVAHAQGIVLLDEAYAEFAPETFVDLVATHERLIVVRTCSKAFGLAGLRVGFGAAGRPVIELVERARGPYKVNAMAERAALGALSPDPGGLPWIREHAALVIQLRGRLVEALRQLGLFALPSVANFVLVPTTRALAIARALSARGVLVRSFADLPRDIPALAQSGGAALRIGVGPWEMMQALLDALAEVLSCE